MAIQTEIAKAAEALTNPNPAAVLAQSAPTAAAPVATASAASPSSAPDKPPAEVPSGQDRLSDRFAVLTKKERQIQLRDKAIADRERRVAEQEKQFGKPASVSEAMKRLEEWGHSYEDITEFYLKGKEPESKKLREIEQRLKEQDEAHAAEKATAAKAEQERAQTAYVVQIKEHCLKDPDKFELINSFEGHQTVFDVIRKHFQDSESSPGAGDGEIMPIPKAVDMVEKYFESELEKYSKLKKLQAKLKPAEPTKAPEPKEPEPSKLEAAGSSGNPKETRTLGNEDSQGTTTATSRPTSRAEDLRRAAQMLTA